MVKALARGNRWVRGVVDSCFAGDDYLDEPAHGRAGSGIGLYFEKLCRLARRSVHLSGHDNHADFRGNHDRRVGSLGFYFRLAHRAHQHALQGRGHERAQHRHSVPDFSQGHGLGISAPPTHRRHQYFFDAAFRSDKSSAQHRHGAGDRFRSGDDVDTARLRDDFSGLAQHEPRAGRSCQRPRCEQVAHPGTDRIAADLAGAFLRGYLDAYRGYRCLRCARRDRHGQ